MNIFIVTYKKHDTRVFIGEPAIKQHLASTKRKVESVKRHKVNTKNGVNVTDELLLGIIRTISLVKEN